MPILRSRGLPRSEASVEPEGQLAFGLQAQPEPGQVDGDAADVTVAGSADAAFSGRIAALVWGRGQAHQGTDLAAVLESSPGELPGIGLGADLGNAAQSHQTPGNLCGTVLALPDPSIPLALEIQKLAMDEAVASDFHLHAAPQARRQGRAVPDPDRIQRIPKPSPADP